MEEREKVLEQRTERVVQFFKNQKNLVTYVILTLILWVGFFVRTRNLGLINDMTTGLPVPIEPDSFAFLRYAKYILEHGTMLVNDPMRYFPNGYLPASEFTFLSHAYVWLYKFLHLFSPDASINFAQVVYPPLAFVVGGIFFFLLVRRLFDFRVALVATAFLAVLPAYMSRTMAGFSDKEALGMVLLFLALYLYVCSFQSNTLKKGIIYGLLAGFITAAMGLAWGGVQFIFVIIGLFAFYEIVFDYFNEHNFYSYAAWFFASMIFLTIVFNTRYDFFGFLTTDTILPATLAFFIGLFRLIIFRFNPFDIKKHLHGRMPFGIFTTIFSTIIIFILYVLHNGWGEVNAKYQEIITGFLSPYAASRWGRTVAESHQPYIREWFSQFGNFYFWLFLIGSVLLVYSAFNIMKKYRFLITGISVIFLAGFLSSRYTSTPPLDGLSPLAQFLYFGSMILLLGSITLLYIYTHRKKLDIHLDLSNISKEYIFVLAWVLVMLVTSRIAVRILFVLAPLTTIPVAFLFVRAYDTSMAFKHKLAKAAGILVVLYFLLSPTVSASLLGSYNTSFDTVSRSGTSYNQQWQMGMKWVMMRRNGNYSLSWVENGEYKNEINSLDEIWKYLE